MPDHATSTDAAVQGQLDRLWALSPGADVLGLDRITALLAALGDPHRRLPPVLHVAGTNGKGSTCAFLRAALEAAGYRVHAYTSPHLVRFNERIRLAGTLIGDDALAPLLGEVLDAAERVSVGASFFEVTTAAAFLAFSRVPADACVIEVGLGGRLDATNVIPRPAACGIAALALDHQAFLGNTVEAIAAEKAGIAKPDVPLVTMAYPPPIAATIARSAASAGAPVVAAGKAWRYRVDAAEGTLAYADARGEVMLPLPALHGAHQAGNLALAAAMLRHQRALEVPDATLALAARTARWPARMQRLGDGPLTRGLPGRAIWLDGGHNPNAGEAIAATLAAVADDAPLALVLGMLANKDVAGFLAPLAPRLSRIVAVPTPGHEHHSPEALVAAAGALGIRAVVANDPVQALGRLGDHPGPVLIAGSLYLAGQVLAANEEAPQ